MINSYALIQCSNAEQMEKLCNFEWSDAIGTHITLYDKHAVIHDYFTEHNFKDILTKLAVYLAQNCPDSNFTIHARIDDKERLQLTVPIITFLRINTYALTAEMILQALQNYQNFTAQAAACHMQ